MQAIQIKKLNDNSWALPEHTSLMLGTKCITPYEQPPFPEVYTKGSTTLGDNDLKKKKIPTKHKHFKS